jgi:hypothetical protein
MFHWHAGVIIPSVIMPSVIIPSVIAPSALMLSIILSVIHAKRVTYVFIGMLSVITPSALMLSVVASTTVSYSCKMLAVSVRSRNEDGNGGRMEEVMKSSSLSNLFEEMWRDDRSPFFTSSVL